MNNTDKILNQLNDDGSVIGYKPDLEYKKQRTAKGTAITNNDSSNTNLDSYQYSDTLNSIIKSCPSNTLSNIDYVINNINKLQNKLIDAFNKSLSDDDNPSSNQVNVYNPYNDINALINADNINNQDYVNKFLNYYDDINGNIIPRLIYDLNNSKKKLDTISNTLKAIYYNNINIDTSIAKEIDNGYINALKTFEYNNQNGKINYISLSFDSILNKAISYNVFNDNSKAIKCAKVIDSNEKAKASINNMDIIESLFKDTQKQLELASRGYQRQEDIELTQKALYNYYEKRKNLNDLYQLHLDNPQSVMLGRKIKEYANKTTNAIINVCKVLMNSQNYLDKITKLEQEKFNIQKIYATISNNF